MDKMPELSDKIVAGYVIRAEGTLITKEWRPTEDPIFDASDIYLRSTPVLERAEEMKDLLVKLSKASSAINITIKNKDRIKKLLASIKKAEGERGGG